MKKLALLLAALMLAAALLTGCGRPINYDLPENPLEFTNASTYRSPVNSDCEFNVVDYNGRQYVSYGFLKGRITGDDVGECLGYYVQDGEKMTDVRFYRLTADPDANFLVQMDTVGFMNGPDFLRALDTCGLDIEIPKFIQINDMALESGIWE